MNEWRTVVHLFDGTSREPTGTRADDEPLANVTSLVDDPQPTSQTNLARGIVWADILADMAADEEARHLRDAA